MFPPYIYKLECQNILAVAKTSSTSMKEIVLTGWLGSKSFTNNKFN